MGGSVVIGRLCRATLQCVAVRAGVHFNGA